MNFKLNKIFEIIFYIAISLAIIILAVKFTLSFKPLYYFDINYLNINKESNLSTQNIKINYNYVIDYLNSKKTGEFNLPTLPSSKYGKIHFKEVRDIFVILDNILISCALISCMGLFINYKNKSLTFIGKVSNALLIIPTILLIPFIVNFNYSFVIFHKIFFRNGYWQFNPKYDPIINLLPETFFFHSALMILSIIMICSVILRIIYRKYKY